MTNQAGFAPAVSMNVVRLTIALMAVGVFAIGLLSPATASADGDVNCTGVVTVGCIGTVDTTALNIVVGNVGLITNSQLNTLNGSFNNLIDDTGNISDINAFAIDFTTSIQTTLNTWITTTTNVITKTCTALVTPAIGTVPSSITITCP